MFDADAGKKPVKVTREELHRQVWEAPMSRLADQYGVTGNGLAKICDRLNVPYPPRGYWAKKAAGKKLVTYRLPDVDEATPTSATIGPKPPQTKFPELPADIQKQVDALRDSSASIAVSKRLVRPHKIIAAWLDKHDQKRREARNERGPWPKRMIDPGQFTDVDRRQHRLLDALFKELERHKGVVREDDQRGLFFEASGEKIEFQLREKQKQTRRAPTREEEREWRKSILEHHPTGKLIFSVKTYLPSGFRREWLETDNRSMESCLPEIVAAFIAAIPVMVKQRVEREEQARQYRIAEQKRHDEEQQRLLVRNRVRRFAEFAQAWRDRQVARDFLKALKATMVEPDVRLAGGGVEDWVAWMEAALDETDPITRGAEFVFGQVAEVHSWTYRD